jgi:hypothetical protein
MTSLTDLPNVKALVEKFDLAIPNGFRGVITDWNFVEGKVGGDFLIIREIKIYDTDGNLVKTADLSILQKNMHMFSFTFSKNEEVQD